MNASKTNTMIVDRSRTMHPQSLPLTIGGTVLNECDDLVLLEMPFDSKMTYEKHHASLGFQSSFSKTWHLEEYWRMVHDRSLLGRCFRGFVLPILEYCSAVWCSAADTHLKLLDHARSQWCPVSNTRF